MAALTVQDALRMDAGVKALRPELRVKLRYPDALLERFDSFPGSGAHPIWVVTDRPYSAAGHGNRQILGIADNRESAWRDAVMQINLREGKDVFDRLWEKRRRKWLVA